MSSQSSSSYTRPFFGRYKIILKHSQHTHAKHMQHQHDRASFWQWGGVCRNRRRCICRQKSVILVYFGNTAIQRFSILKRRSLLSMLSSLNYSWTIIITTAPERPNILKWQIYAHRACLLTSAGMVPWVVCHRPSIRLTVVYCVRRNEL